MKGSFLVKNNKSLFLALAILTTGLFFISKSSSAQTINTGDATSETVVENVVNTNIIKCKECVTPSPTIPVETPTPTVPTITETPTQERGGGEQPGDGGGIGGPSGEVLGAKKQGEVLGLSVTSGEGNMLFQIGKLLPSLFLSIISLSFLKKNEKTKTASKKRK